MRFAMCIVEIVCFCLKKGHILNSVDNLSYVITVFSQIDAYRRFEMDIIQKNFVVCKNILKLS
jgi:cell fate (sporulation/competence/biofilm development) regulator YmcA (YheA/YmcA/DUF963 family)